LVIDLFSFIVVGRERDTGPDRSGLVAGTEAVHRSDPGTRSVEHLNENQGALSVELTPAEVQQISTESGSLQVYGGRMDADNMALVE
jgi:hypothetical protein